MIFPAEKLPEHFLSLFLQRLELLNRNSRLFFRMAENTKNETEDWQNKLATMEQKVAFVYRMNVLTDVVINVSDGFNTQAFNTNRFVLAVSSPFFYVMFTANNWKESTGEIILEETDPKLFGLFLEFVYCGDVKLSSVKEARELYTLSDRFLYNKLKLKCLEYLYKNIDNTSVCAVCHFAEAYKLKDLEKLCSAKIHQSTEEILDENNYSNLDVFSMCTILQQPSLSISETKLFKYVQKWVEWKTENGELLSSDVVDEIVQKFCFMNMTLKDFAEGPASSGMLKDEICCSIFCNMCSENSKRPYPTGYNPYIRTCYPILNFHTVGYNIESLMCCSILFDIDNDIYMTGVEMWTREGPRMEKYREKIRLILYAMGNNTAEIMSRRVIEQEFEYATQFNIKFEKRVIVKKNRRYWLSIKVYERKNYKLARLNGVKLTASKTTFNFYEDSSPDYPPRLPLSAFYFETN